MMRFYAIVSRQQADKHGVDLSLSRACEARGLDYVRLITEEVVLDDMRTLDVPSGSLLYRVSTGAKAAAIESILTAFQGQDLTTIYRPKQYTGPRRPFAELIAQMVTGMNIIPTVIVDETWLTATDEVLERRTHSLGGFPVLMKTLGLSHGQGVQRIESMQDLRDKLKELDFSAYGSILRKYLHDYRHYRVIVVDGKVRAVIEYHKPEDDFRTNATETPEVTAVPVDTLSSKISDLAVQSVDLRSSLLGGVDILVDTSDGEAFLAEVNVPCYYARAEGPTSIDISGALIDAMLVKRNGSIT